MSRTRLALFISGGGRTALNIADRIDTGRLDAEIALVVASRQCTGLDRVRDRGLPVVLEPGPIGRERTGEIVRSCGAKLVCLAGYLHLLPIPEGWTDRVLNIHPSLLPRFGGFGMYGDAVHRAVLASGENVSGCTVHLCTDEYDRGPIIVQRRCPVLPDDTVETLADRVFELECLAYPEAIGEMIRRMHPATR
ncbi:MAG TPA: phosphoribosylglycinamide formyltransferase [Phycisphaerales bacterium]|nr:phosphoribosylglycinamide formyltransferase [Phycisphaerales bacterium]